MHTTYNKISARERENAPRFYYKVTHKTSCWQQVKNVFRYVLAFLFTQIGVCALVACYMVMGAFLFSSLEAESAMEHAVLAQKLRRDFTKQLWNVTLETNVIFDQIWLSKASQLVQQFQEETVDNIKCGYTGNDVGVKVWTLSSALMFSLTVFTTIGTYIIISTDVFVNCP